MISMDPVKKPHVVVNHGVLEVEVEVVVSPKLKMRRAQANSPRFYSSLRHFDQ
jgi:hypothetical protein